MVTRQCRLASFLPIKSENSESQYSLHDHLFSDNFYMKVHDEKFFVLYRFLKNNVLITDLLKPERLHRVRSLLTPRNSTFSGKTLHSVVVHLQGTEGILILGCIKSWSDCTGEILSWASSRERRGSCRQCPEVHWHVQAGPCSGLPSLTR